MKHFEGVGPGPEKRRAHSPVRPDLQASIMNENTWFGAYELLEPIGRGGFGVVHRARQQSLGREVAIKILERTTPVDLGRFQREVEIQSRLSHRHLVKIFDAGIEGDKPYVAMELLQGVTLDRMIEDEGPLSQGHTCGLMLAIISAIEYLHGMGVIHRDLKPANVFIDLQGNPKVLDFGLSRAHDSATLTASGSLLGTPLYMAPEVFLHRQYGPEGDAYSVGIMMYKMLTGLSPFSTDSLGNHVKQKVKGPPRPLDEVDPKIEPGLSHAVGRMLVVDPAERLTLTELVQVLRAAVEGGKGSQRERSRERAGREAGRARERPAAPPPGGKKGGGNRTMRWTSRGILVAGASLVLSMGTIGSYWMGDVPPPDPGSSGEHSSAAPMALPPYGVRVREWHHRIHSRVPPLAREGADGNYWKRLLVGLARATRAPLHSLNQVTTGLSGPASSAARREVLDALATGALGTLIPDLHLPGNDRTPEETLSPEDRWKLLEIRTVVMLLARTCQVSGAANSLLDPSWPRGMATFRILSGTDDKGGWQYLDCFLIHPDFGDSSKEVDILQGANRSKPPSGLDAITGAPRRPADYTAMIEERIPMIETPGISRDRIGIGLWAVVANPALLFEGDLLWVTLPGHSPLLVHAGLLEALPSGDENRRGFFEIALPEGCLGSPTEVVLRVQRENLFATDGPSGASLAIGVGWLRALRGKSAALHHR